ncbi:restriction endonuclease subunit S [Enterococcus faecalis]|uniref:restriction endonuclease subunit S n=1 Tax=Enterococcus faecalis TaxID=1351 RepID=UPI00203264FA|nr:restriction endonuclease subunit S [Enterococcus faecalis]MCU2201939.1 restriction endonuclease subunit S [Enterococcus faecalis]
MAKIDDSVKKKDPELRFKGFTDEWEERKLKDIAQFNPKTVLPDEFEYVDLESVVGTEMISHRTESKDQAPSRAQRLAQKGDVFYQTVRPYQMNNYLYDLPYDNYVFSTGYAQMRPNIDSYFLLNSVQNKQFVQHVLDRSTGTSYPAINSSDLSNIEIHVPSKLSEQQKIGSFFKQLDDTIALHQRKLDLLKEQKKGYLQKMFPKNGAKVPELRFAGFADDWEERKLGDVGDTFTGLTGKTKEDFGHGSAKFVTYVNVFQNPIATLDQLDAVEIDEKQNQVQKGDVFFTTSSETPEEVGMSSVWTYDTKNVYLNSFTFGYRPRVSFDLNYMASMLRSPSIRKKITFLAQGISRYNISKTKMLEIEIPAPNLSEQKKIGSFFKLLDDTIALHQRKLDLLKEQKKGFLQKMFV